ncbi:MAG: hypothetical protein AB4057_21440 [Crocosphaera sp.]
MSRQVQDVSKPGIDNDLEMMGTGDTWTIIWTQPLAIIENTQQLIRKAIT